MAADQDIINKLGAPALIAPQFILDSLLSESLKEADKLTLKSKLGCCGKNTAKVWGYLMRYFVKSQKWLPSFGELIIYVTFIAIVFIVIEILHNQSISARVKKESRCIKERNNVQDQVTAYDSNNNSLYTVKYDPATKKHLSTECVNENPSGRSTNEYNQIKTYSIDTGTARTDNSKTCKQNFDAAGGTRAANTGTISYSGDANLVQYMYNNDLSYFAR